MGLDTTHDCWHGPYSFFNKWRRQIAETAGYGDLEEYKGFGSHEKPGTKEWPDNGDPLLVLLDHSDCDGQIDHEFCYPIANRLEGLLITEGFDGLDGWYKQSTEQFINGLRRAHEAKEPVLFQ